MATNVVGGIESYLSGNVDRIKDWIIRMFDVGTELNQLFDEFFIAFADVFSVFSSQTAQDITGAVIQIFSDVFGGVLEVSLKFVNDILAAILKPFTENKDRIKEAAENTLKPIKDVVESAAEFVQTAVDEIVALYDDHIHPFFESIQKGLTELWQHVLDAYNTHIAPVLDKLGTKFKEIMEGPVKDALDSAMTLIGKLIDIIKMLWENVVQPFLVWCADTIVPTFAPIFEEVGMVFLELYEAGAEWIGALFDVLSGLLDFIVGVFTNDWDLAWSGLHDALDGLLKMADTVFGSIISLAETMIGWVNKAIKALKKLFKTKESEDSGDYEDDSGDYEDYSYESYSGYAAQKRAYSAVAYRVPKLASGTVVPPRAGEFAAILGDNNRETEVVSPVSTMKQAFLEALAESGGYGGEQNITIRFEGNLAQFVRQLKPVLDSENKRVGVKLVTVGGR